MRIGISVEVARDERPTGIGKHVVRLVDALAQIDSQNEYYLYYASPILGRSAQLSFCPTAANFRPRPVRFPRHWINERPRAWWNEILPRILRRDRIEIFHGPNHFLPRWSRDRSIVTIHDLAYFFMPVHGEKMDAALRHWTIHAFDNAARVIALSENTKRDVNRLGISDDKIDVIYGGGDTLEDDCIAWHRIDELRNRLRLPAEYILFVGAIQPRKNIPFLLRAFARMREKHALPHELVLAGPKESATDEVVRLASELKIADSVRMLGYLEDWEIPLLYKQAAVFSLPTRYEGFTLVTLEAMAYGTPVVATDTSSIREGTGKAALLVPPDNVDAFADAMFRVITEDRLRDQMIGEGRFQAAKFTWKNCARQTIALYETVYRHATTEQPRRDCPVAI